MAVENHQETKRMPSNLTVAEELAELDKKIIAAGGASEFTGVENLDTHNYRYLFVSHEPITGHAEALKYMQDRLKSVQEPTGRVTFAGDISYGKTEDGDGFASYLVYQGDRYVGHVLADEDGRFYAHVPSGDGSRFISDHAELGEAITELVDYF